MSLCVFSSISGDELRSSAVYWRLQVIPLSSSRHRGKKTTFEEVLQGQFMHGAHYLECVFWPNLARCFYCLRSAQCL